jgi:anti-anti-sigma factor
MATYDRLGQTLVATLTVDAIAGHEAIGLAAEIYDRVIGESEPTGIRHVVFDVQNVQYMDSTCVGVFVELLGKLQEAGGRIALVNADSNVEYLFKLTRLDRLFPICRDVMKAIDAVERGA